jgi:hypothetical protein
VGRVGRLKFSRRAGAAKAGPEPHLMARQAFHPALVLALEKVDDETVVALLVDLPLLLAGDLGRQRVELGLARGRHRNRLGPDQDPVEIFMQAIEQEGEELLRVVLVDPVEGRGKLDDRFLLEADPVSRVRAQRAVGRVLGTYPERQRLDKVVLLLPEGRNERAVGTREVAFGAEVVVKVDGSLPAAVAEEGRERLGCAQALERRILVARAAGKEAELAVSARIGRSRVWSARRGTLTCRGS